MYALIYLRLSLLKLHLISQMGYHDTILVKNKWEQDAIVYLPVFLLFAFVKQFFKKLTTAITAACGSSSTLVHDGCGFVHILYSDF
jgi:hypothetical protein